MKLGSKRFKLGTGWGTLILLLLLAGNALAANCDSCIFVKPAGNDANDGLSWDTAKKTISAALRTAGSGDTIHVAQGTYQENIALKSNVNLLGGYSGDGGRVLYDSTINGMDKGSVVTATNVNQGKLDGFTITNGDATYGGGIFAQGGSVVISNNKIEDNDASNGGGVYLTGFSGRFSNNLVQNNRASRGAGLYCNRLQAAGEVDNNTIKNNTASMSGGGISLYNSTGELYNNTIQGNKAFSGPGGGVHIADFSGLFANNLLDNNSARNGGGGYLTDFSFGGMILNCTVANNSTTGLGDGFFVDTDFDGQIKNTIIWNNGDDAIYCESALSGVTYCDIEGGYPGVGNIDADPLFTGNYRLRGGSPCIKAGDDGTNMGHTGGGEVGESSVSNQRPVAAAGNNQAVEAASCDGAEVTLDGSGSSDPDGCIVSYGWTWAGGTASGCSPSALLPLGTHVVTLTVSDGELTDTDTVSITVGYTSNNIIAITSPQDEACVSSSPITVSGLVGGDCVTVEVNGVDEVTIYEDNSFSASDVPLLEGDNEITAVVTNTADGSTGSDTITVTLDTIDPEVIITSHEEGECVNSSPITVTYTVDGVEKSVSKELDEGTNTITVEGTDDCGNTGSDEIIVTLDTILPEVVITSHENGEIVCDVSITVTYTVDGEEKSVSKNLNEGANTITISDTDGCDNTGSDSIVVHRDVAPEVADIPDQSINEGAEFTSINLDDYVTDTYDSDSTIGWTYSGNSELTVIIGSDRVATISIPDTDWNGGERITFTTNPDPCGFSDSDAATFTVQDITTPSSSANPAGGTYTSTQSVTLTADDSAATIYYTTDGSTPTTGSSTYSSAISISTDTTLNFFAEDAAGNQESVNTESYTIVTCKGALSISRATYPASKWSDISSLVMPTTSSSNATITCDAPEKLPVGTTTVTCTIKDAAGNSSTCTTTVTVSAGNAPSISCPSNISVAAGSGCKTSFSSFSSTFVATATDHNGSSLTVTNDAPDSFSLGTTTTVTFTATDDDMGKSSSCTATVTVVDETAPIITCPSDRTVTTESNETTVSLSLAATATDECSTPTVTNNAPGSYPIGDTTVTFTASDTAGNNSSCSTKVTVNASGLAGGSKVVEEGSTSAAASAVSAGGGTAAAGGETKETSAKEKTEGTGKGEETGAGAIKLVILSPASGTVVSSSPIIVRYSLNGAAKSVARALTEGNNSITIAETDSSGRSGSASITVTLDSTPPKVVITSPGNGVTLAATPITVNYTLDDKTKKVVSKALEEGANIITIEETDSLGRVGSDTITVNLDSVAPVVIITSPENGATVATTPVTVSYTVNGELKTVSKELTEGENTISIEETDRFGRKGSDSITLTLDPNAPVVVITSPAPGATVDSTPVTVNYTLDGAAKSISKELVEGANTITISETNASGQTGSASITVILDTTAPLVTITSPKDGVTVASSPITVTYTVDGAIKTVSKALTEGKNTISITETDSLGRSGSTSITVTMDSSVPAVVITSHKDGDTVAATPIIVEYTVDGTPKRVSWDLVEGPNNVSIKETDAFGRTGSASITLTLARAPLVCPKDLTVEQETPQGTKVALRASAPDPAKPVKNITSDRPKIFPPGTTTVTFKGKTKDGETVTCSCKVTIEDTTPPRVALLLSPKKEVYFSSDSFFITYLVKDKADAKPEVKLELINGEKGKAKDITASASLPLKMDNYVGDNSLTFTATDAAGNKSSVTVKFKVILKLDSSHLQITPKVLKLKPGIFTLTLTFPEPYDLGGISNVTADGAPAEEIKFERKTTKKKVKVVKAQLKFRREKITVKPIDNKFEIKGEFVHQGAKCQFVGYASIDKVEAEKKKKSK